MPVITETAAMKTLKQRLIEERKVAESSAQLYLAQLVRLNDGPFKNLKFLNDTAAIMAKLDGYAPSTKKTILGGIVSVMSLYKSGPYRKLGSFYRSQMMGAQKDLEDARGETTDKTEKEKENWVDWADVIKKRDELHKEVAGFGKDVTPEQYQKLLANLLLSLYTYIPPRRNKDYQDMWVVRQWSEAEPADRNYLDLHGQRFIFNVYKTAKHTGQQVIEIPETDEASPLKDAIVAYLRHNPHYKASKNKAKTFRFLTRPNGEPLTTVNAITRILNAVFGKKVGSSMLRHSYLSDRYGGMIAEMAGDASAMAHSMDTQRTYIRGGDDTDVITHIQ
jgi:hypothetical protein